MAKGYVEGFVLVVPKKNVAKYIKMAEEGRDTWMKFGALDYKESVLEDARAKEVGVSFPKLANAKPSETVWFSYITYKSKKHRDQVNKKVMAFFEKKYATEQSDMPFDLKRFSVGGFNVEVSS